MCTHNNKMSFFLIQSCSQVISNLLCITNHIKFIVKGLNLAQTFHSKEGEVIIELKLLTSAITFDLKQNIKIYSCPKTYKSVSGQIRLFNFNTQFKTPM